MFESERSASRLDSSFNSFVNATSGEQEDNLEMVFSNKALLKIMGVDSTKDLHSLLMKPLFVNQENGTKLSLLTIVDNRYSDVILGQDYEFERKSGNQLEEPRVVCF